MLHVLVQWCFLQQPVSPPLFGSPGILTQNLFLDGPVWPPAPCFISIPYPRLVGNFGQLCWPPSFLSQSDSQWLCDPGWVSGHLWAPLSLSGKWGVGSTWEDWTNGIILGWLSRWTLDPASPSLNCSVATYQVCDIGENFLTSLWLTGRRT